jgi:hypothetical protein
MQAARKALSSTHRVLAVLVALDAMTACGGGSDAPTKSPSLNAISSLGIRIQGSGQRGFVGELLADAVSAQVVDSSSRPVIGRRRIRLLVVEGGGSVSDTVVFSNESGLASVSWRLGKTAGQQQLAASLADPPLSAEQPIFATALSLESADVILVSGATAGIIGVLVRKDAGRVAYTLTWPDTVLRLLPRSAEGTSEEVTAFTVGHPPVTVLQPWTSGVDTVRVAFRLPIEVPLTIWIAYDFDTTAARARHDLAALDGFWRAQMIGLRVGRVRVDSAPNLLFECGGDTRGYFDRAAINVYYMKYGAPPEACDAHIIRMHATNPASFLDDYALILAHEVGHALSLDHVSDPGNIMWPQSPPGHALRTGQIYWMHFHDWGALNSIIGVHPVGERNCHVQLVSQCPAQTFSVW